MTPELALDLVRLQPLMDKANDPGADAQTVAAAFAAGQVVVRAHNQQFAEYFAGRLNGVALTFNRGEFNYSFRDAADAAQAFTMLSMQQGNDSKSAAISGAVVNLLLRDMKYKSSFDSDQEYLTTILMIAHSMHAFRRTIFSQLVAEQQLKPKVSVWPYVLAGACIVGAGFFLLG
ncbi:hypothetical protein [Stenotrophomonas rhizophila]|uniref:Uncharacterized protein n=1 Tax=Stenotrophomonas rhizophila TaxID=216778 RepID=A0A7V8CDW6_9GAMM|nr:hypothetical protein [Stenotrophomonas rhizophila]KAB7628884.1 hypothetical protein F9K92_15665 [Stenotrophomonas rhizophila]